jgi:lipopolysaccharide export system permease protein
MGISPMVLVWPTMILATLVSLGTVVLNDLAVSWGRRGAERVVIESLEEIAYGQLEMFKTFRIGQYNITVRDVDGERLIQPMIIEQKSDGDDPASYSAEWAVLKAFPDEGNIQITMYDVEGSLGDDNGGIHPGKLELVQPLDAIIGGGSGQRSPSNYALQEIPDGKNEERAQIETFRREMTTDAAFSLLAGDFDKLSNENWQAHDRRLAGSEYRLHRFNTEPYRRWSNGFSCLAFVMVGAAMAIRLRQSDFLAIFFICFLPILLVYYPLLMVSLDKAKGGALPPQAVWLGNIVLALWGAWLMRRVIRF